MPEAEAVQSTSSTRKLKANPKDGSIVGMPPKMADRWRRRGNFKQWQRLHDPCVYCGKLNDGNSETHNIDHYIPKSYGGNNSSSNRVPSCTMCNSHKRSRKGIVYLLEHHHRRVGLQKNCRCLVCKDQPLAVSIASHLEYARIYSVC